MKVQFEITKEEIVAGFGENFDMKKPIEILLGKEVFTCYITQYSTRTEGWNSKLVIRVDAEGRSKRLQEIAEAKALVNKTKEAHKEAQRKLAELQENK